MSKDWFQDIVDFRKEMEQYIPKPFKPSIPQDGEVEFCRELVREEVSELFEAMSVGNIPKIADGIADSIVVILGVSVAYGIDIRPIWNEVHKTNMAKIRGAIRADGKKLKPEGWEPPDIEGELAKQL